MSRARACGGLSLTTYFLAATAPPVAATGTATAVATGIVATGVATGMTDEADVATATAVA